MQDAREWVQEMMDAYDGSAIAEALQDKGFSIYEAKQALESAGFVAVIEGKNLLRVSDEPVSGFAASDLATRSSSLPSMRWYD